MSRLTLAAAFVAFAIVVLWPAPMRQNADSRFYLRAAESFAQGHDEPTFREFPPGLPIVLATGISPRFLNAVCYALTLALILSHSAVNRGAIALALLSPLLLYIHIMVLSDALFVFVTTLFLIELPRKRVLPLALILTMAVLLKYSGVFLLVFALAYRLHAYGLKNAVIAVFLPSVALAGWALRNAALTGSLLGERGARRFAMAESIVGTGITLAQFGGVLCGLVCLEICISRLRRGTQDSSYSRP